MEKRGQEKGAREKGMRGGMNRLMGHFMSPDECAVKLTGLVIAVAGCAECGRYGKHTWDTEVRANEH